MDLTDTSSWEKLEGEVQTLWRIGSGIGTLFVAGLGVGLEFLIESGGAVSFPGVGLLALGMFFVFGAFGQWLVSKRYERYRFLLGEDDLAVSKGVFWRSWRFISRNRVQHVDITSGPIARMLGLVEVTIYVGGMATAAATIPGLTTRRGEELRKKLVKDVLPEPVVDASPALQSEAPVWEPPGVSGGVVLPPVIEPTEGVVQENQEENLRG